jgi:hypothetical protein
MNFKIFRRFNFILLLGGTAVSIIVFVVGLTQGMLPAKFWIYRCDPSLYGDNKFLAYCSDSSYGGYEHGAIYFGLEKDVVANLRSAHVLILGSSRAQLGFSSPVVDEYFSNRGLRYFNLGFNYWESDLFARRVIERHDLKPNVVIVNADYFFTNEASPAAKKVLSRSKQVEFEYFLKGWVQHSHQDICIRNKFGIGQFLCGHRPALYRSRLNGRTFVASWPRNFQDDATKKHEPSKDALERLIGNAVKFKKFLDARKVCLVITVIPSTTISSNPGKKIAGALNVPFILPKVKNLSYLDGNHLDEAGASVWSSDFFKKFDKLNLNCTTH